MKVRFIAILAILFAAIVDASGQCTPSWSTSKSATFAQGSAPSLGAAGTSLCDPVFDTEIIRITSGTSPATGSWTNAYSYWPTFNADNTRILAFRPSDANARIITFNPSTLAVGSAVEPPYSVQSYETTFFWSYLNADYAYGTNGSNIVRYSVASNSYTTLHNLSGETIGSGGKYFWQISLSADDDKMAFTVRNSGGSVWGYAAVDVSSGAVLFSEATSSVDEVQIDKGGRYIVVKTGNEGAGQIKTKVVDLQAGPAAIIHNWLSDEAPYPYGHSDLGVGKFFGYDNWNDTIGVIDLATEADNVIINNAWGGTFDIGEGHYSMLYDSGNEYGLVSNYGGVSSQVFDNEIWFVRFSDEEVFRFVKHYSVSPDYTATPRANVSLDGRFVAFTSNWGNSGRTDIFVAVVPEGMVDGGGGGGGSQQIKISGGVRLRGVRL